MTAKQSPMRIFMMLPMMYFMGKIDFENPTILISARSAFIFVQIFSLLLGLYIRNQIKYRNDTRKIYIPSSASPLDPTPNYEQVTESTYFDHETSKVSEFIKQTCIGALISSVIHFKFGVNQVVVIQSLMAPINWYDNPLVQAYVFGKRKGRIWNELLEGESAEDAKAATNDVSIPEASKSKKCCLPANTSPSEAIVKTFAAEGDADFENLWEIIKSNVNVKTEEDNWTALMIACSSPLDTDEFIREVINAGAQILATDNDGWTALHWSAFHGRPEATETLLSMTPRDLQEELIACRTNDGRTAECIAAEEKNADVAEIISKHKEHIGLANVDNEDEDTSLRQRKNASNMQDVD